MVRIIGLGECCVSSTVEDSIKTYALSSCIGLVVYNYKDRVLGVVHIVLPEQKEINASHKEEGFFAETAVPFIFGKVFGRYPNKSTDYRVSLYGGCCARNGADIFNVGQRNLAKIEQILSARNIIYDKVNTGGYCSRTIEAYVKDGTVRIHEQMMMM